MLSKSDLYFLLLCKEIPYDSDICGRGGSYIILFLIVFVTTLSYFPLFSFLKHRPNEIFFKKRNSCRKSVLYLCLFVDGFYFLSTFISSGSGNKDLVLCHNFHLINPWCTLPCQCDLLRKSFISTTFHLCIPDQNAAISHIQQSPHSWFLEVTWENLIASLPVANEK